MLSPRKRDRKPTLALLWCVFACGARTELQLDDACRNCAGAGGTSAATGGRAPGGTGGAALAGAPGTSTTTCTQSWFRCTKSAECCSGMCANGGVCVECKTIGQPCTYGGQCCSGICDETSRRCLCAQRTCLTDGDCCLSKCLVDVASCAITY